MPTNDGDAERVVASAVGRGRRQHAPSAEADDERRQRLISAEPAAPALRAAGASCRAQRGFLNLKMTRSVLPRIFGSNTSRL